MTELALTWQWITCWLSSRRVHTSSRDLVELRDLIERASYDLEQGWPEAAYDCIGRALRLLRSG